MFPGWISAEMETDVPYIDTKRRLTAGQSVSHRPYNILTRRHQHNNSTQLRPQETPSCPLLTVFSPPLSASPVQIKRLEYIVNLMERVIMWA